MSILRWVRGNSDAKLIARHVDRIVARYADAVTEATVARAAGMPPAEARGYVRAKAVSIVAAAIAKQGEKGEPLDRRLHEIVLTLSAERLTAAISSRLSHSSKHATKRKAA
jgi:hypothetical protein